MGVMKETRERANDGEGEMAKEWIKEGGERKNKGAKGWREGGTKEERNEGELL
jgi:hypothetical protein